MAEYRSYSRQAQAQIRAEMRRVLRDALRLARDEIRAAAPKRTGKLRRNIRYRIRPNDSRTGYIGTVGATREAFYAAFVEAGHAIVVGPKGQRRVVGFVPPRPFLRPTLQRIGPDIERILGQPWEV